VGRVRQWVVGGDVSVMMMVVVRWRGWVWGVKVAREGVERCCERSRVSSLRRCFGGLKGHLAFRRKMKVVAFDVFEFAERLRFEILGAIVGVWRGRVGEGRSWRMKKMLKG